MITAEQLYKPAQIQWALNYLDSLTTHLNIPLFSKWAADNRYIPPGVSDWYGQFDPELTPHLIEILDRLHPDDPCRIITFMKSVQSAGTVTIIESAMGAVICYKLGSMLFLISTKSIGEIRVSANIDTMIDNSNLAHLVKPMSNRTGKKNKDNSSYKEFVGGIKLIVTSYNSIADLKSNTVHYIFEDELDEAKAELKDQGDIEGIIEGRTLGVLNYKIFKISTPSRAETYRIYKNFLEGDQREYFMPCPVCGEEQLLVLKRRGEKYGLTFTRETHKASGKKRLIPETVRYICKHCEKDFYESKKQWMLQNGIWRPQATAQDPLHHSYHASGLISPFLPWQRIAQKFIDTRFGDDLLKFKDFTINVLGNPWMAVRKTASWEMLKKRAENYCMGEVPEGEKIIVSGQELTTGPMLLYAGADVQKDRLEMCVTGFGINGNKHIVDYQIFYGKTENIDDPCWIALDDYVYNHEYKILGKEAYIEMCAIDAGYNPKAEKRDKDYAGKNHIVYDFVSTRIDKFIAIMGNPDDKAIGILKESRITETQTLLMKRYLVSVSLLKEMVMNVIDNSQGHNTIHVPKYQKIQDIKAVMPDEFYQQFLSERYQENPKKPGTYIWKKIRNRNEVLDTFLYSIGAADYAGVTRWTNEVWSSYYQELMAA